MEYYGYAGRILFVDLTTGNITKEPLDLGLAEKLLGGPGLGFHLLARHLKPNTNPLSPENPIAIGIGPMGGTLVPGSGKCTLTMKYPIRAGKHGEKFPVSLATGGSRRFGSMLKNAGYDQVVLTGRAAKPSYVMISNDDVDILDARDIWGKDIHETYDLLVKKHRGKTGKCGTWTIGQAAENLVDISQATLDDTNSLGRHVGAVLGSKNLKAVVTYGDKGIKVKDIKAFTKIYNKKREEIIKHPKYQPLPDYHHPLLQEIYERDRISVKGCTACLGSCRSTMEAKFGRFQGQTYHGGDFTVSVDFGRRLKLNEPGEMYKLMDLMNRYGVCMLTALRMIYFVTRLYERGVISSGDTGGLELQVGNVDSYTALLHKIVNKEDIGAFMAEGWNSLCARVGVDAGAEPKDGCSIVKGIDTLTDSRFWPSHFAPTMGLTNIVHSKGKHAHAATYWPAGPDIQKDTYWPDPLQSLGDIKRDTVKMGVSNRELDSVFSSDSFSTGKLAKHTQDAEYVYNALGLCACVVHWECDPTRDMPWLSELHYALTGMEISPRELLRVGERIWNVERLLNAREGFTRQDDEIPALWLQNTVTPIKMRGVDQYLMDWFGNRLSKESIEAMLDDYYRERGWDLSTGIPSRGKLIELGLESYLS